jgi:hypothetical protein
MILAVPAVAVSRPSQFHFLYSLPSEYQILPLVPLGADAFGTCFSSSDTILETVSDSKPVVACDIPGICVANDTPKCAGFLGEICQEGAGLHCYDYPGDSCDPKDGGADCIGICLSPL